MIVKICGIKTGKAARAAVSEGADFLGLVFYPPSPRYLDPEAAVALLEVLNGLEQKPKLVGLFVNAPYDKIVETAQQMGLDYLQLSGDETPEQCAELAILKPVIKSLRLPRQISPEEALERAAPFAHLENVTLLLDTQIKGAYGGTGEIGDWEAAGAVAKAFPVILAGGLTPDNIGEAIEKVQPWGVDVSSGVESTGLPGEKDPDKIALFIHTAKLTASRKQLF